MNTILTRDEIIKTAREAGMDPHDMSSDWTVSQQDLERFAALVAAAEREECAKVCEHLAELNRKGSTDSMWEQEECAAAIRERGKA